MGRSFYISNAQSMEEQREATMLSPHISRVVEDRHKPNTHSGTRQCKNGRNDVWIKEDKLEGSGMHIKARASPTCTQPIHERWALGQGIQMVWFGNREKGGLFWGSCRGFFWEKFLAGITFCPKKVSMAEATWCMP